MNDNWEDLLTAEVVEIKKVDEVVKARFHDEDVEDPAEREKKEKAKEEQKNESPPKETKKKAEKKNINEKAPTTIDPFGGAPVNPKIDKTKPNYDEKKQKELLSKESDEKNIEELFADLKFENKNIEDLQLKDENAHVQFAKVVGKILNRSNVKLHVVEFYKELLTSFYSKFTSKEYQDINAKVNVLFNQKQKEEKPLNTKKKATKPTLKTTKADQNQIIDDQDDMEGEEEVPAYVPKFNQEDDFM